MNVALISLEVGVVVLGLALLLAELVVPAGGKRALGYAAACVLALLFLNSFSSHCSCALVGQTAFGGMFVQDALSVFFKRLFLLAAALVLLMAVEFSDRLGSGVTEYYALIVFALAGMLVAASANDFVLMFVAIELITITFYVLSGFQRARLVSLEAGVKYLILGALASAFMVFGIALVWGTTGKFNFGDIATASGAVAGNKVFLMGLLMVMAGLGFKIAAVPFQVWVPDVYQGAPTPTTAFLAIGSKAAGFVLLLRVLFGAVPEVTAKATTLLMWVAALTILYGNLCAVPQCKPGRSIKRLLGYSSIAHAGYLLLGAAALSKSGLAAMLYYLSGYLFTVLAAFLVIGVVMRESEAEDISSLAGLGQRAPFLAATMTIAMASLAGVPPLAGFFGKFLLLKAVIERGAVDPSYYALAFAALAGIVVSLYYYFGVVRVMYWGKLQAESGPVPLSVPAKLGVAVCVGGMFYLGLFPGAVLKLAAEAVSALPVQFTF
ncbi:MAG: NADH-quinone oxidoreductase subunit N [Verrucomicrobiae bacterium]|nr:NADH-quinone oxidoreductase subunit N [Verrucomicrobiae bacterium]